MTVARMHQWPPKGETPTATLLCSGKRTFHPRKCFRRLRARDPASRPLLPNAGRLGLFTPCLPIAIRSGKTGQKRTISLLFQVRRGTIADRSLTSKGRLAREKPGPCSAASGGLQAPIVLGVASTDRRSCDLPLKWNRFHSAELGRFVGRDPIGYEAGALNLHTYVKNVPTNAVDPLGLLPPDDGLNPPGTLFPGSGWWDDAPPSSPPPNVVWPASGGASASKKNKETLLGFNICCFTPPTRDERVSKIPGVVTYDPPSTGAGTGENIIYGPPTTNVGTEGAAPCIALIVNCPGSGVAVFHFKAGDDPAGTLGSMTWPVGCKAIVCGGSNDCASNCLADYVIEAAKSKFELEGVSDSNGCGVTKDGKWWVNGKVG